MHCIRLQFVRGWDVCVAGQWVGAAPGYRRSIAREVAAAEERRLSCLFLELLKGSAKGRGGVPSPDGVRAASAACERLRRDWVALALY